MKGRLKAFDLAAGKGVRRPTTGELDQVAGEKFRSREPVDQTYTNRQPMVYRTGRDRAVSIKTSESVRERFYAIAERQGWKVGETFERAVKALEDELGQGRG